MRPTLTHSRPRGRALASCTFLLALAVALVSGTVIGAEQDPQATSPDAGTRFDSVLYPYSMTLPPGWRVIDASQDPGSDQDLFEGPEGTARVGTGIPEPGQTVADRVADNRAGLAPGCSSGPADDWPTTLGAEQAIGWSWRCDESFTVAINAIHEDLGYRLSVSVPVDTEPLAAPLLESLRSDFTFTVGSDEPATVAADLASLEAALEGTYETAWHPVELEYATLEAAGFGPEDEPSWFGYMGSISTARHALKLEDGTLTLYTASDGGPLEVGWLGRFRLTDDHTIEAVESGTFTEIVYEFTLEDGVLALDVISDSDPVDIIPQTAIYETLPFTRVP
jgi:hypothetical protein